MIHSTRIPVGLLTACFILHGLTSLGQNYSIVGTAGTQSQPGQGPNPFAAVDNTSRGTRQQYIIRGQELIDAGIPAGANIVSVGFNVMQAATNSGNVQNLSNWSVSLYSNNNPASSSPLGSWVTAPEVATSAPTTMNVSTTGWKHTDMIAPYQWPGGPADNIIIQACYNNATTNANNSSAHALVQRTTNLPSGQLGGNRGRWVFTNATSGACTSTSGTATTSQYLRPLVQLGWTGTVQPGNTLGSPDASACGSTSLSMQNPGSGVTYQWQSSPDNVSYTNVPNATGPTQSVSPSVPTWYQCVVTSGGTSGNSTPLLVQPIAPAPGATTGPASVSCTNAQLGIQNNQFAGTTYQWQASTIGDVGPGYSPTGGTAATYSAAVTQPTWFRCLVTCSNTGLQTTSTALLVTPNEPNAGDDAAETLCATDAPIDLIALLGPDAQAGGMWSGPSTVVNNTFDPATMTGGAYVYTVTGTAPCPPATATVTMVVDPCLGVNEIAQEHSIQWLGQESDGSHAIMVFGTAVEAWELLDAAGRAVANGTSTLHDGMLRLHFAGVAPCVHVLRMHTSTGAVSLRIVHAVR